MGLQAMEAGELLSRRRVYPANEVDALLARIRAAVVAEREAAAADTGNASGWVARTMKARAALGALLADGDA